MWSLLQVKALWISSQIGSCLPVEWKGYFFLGFLAHMRCFKSLASVAEQSWHIFTVVFHVLTIPQFSVDVRSSSICWLLIHSFVFFAFLFCFLSGRVCRTPFQWQHWITMVFWWGYEAFSFLFLWLRVQWYTSFFVRACLCVCFCASCHLCSCLLLYAFSDVTVRTA